MHTLVLARRLLTVTALLGLTACAYLPTSDIFLGVITPYRIDVVQGNVVTKEQMDLVKPGLTRLQVREALGAPLLTDIFHENRWDYVFSIQRPKHPPQRRNVALHFDGDKLVRIEAPELPAERAFVASLGTRSPSGAVPVLELSEAQRRALPAPAQLAVKADDLAARGPLRNYPPLEPR